MLKWVGNGRDASAVSGWPFSTLSMTFRTRALHYDGIMNRSGRLQGTETKNGS